MTTKRCVNIVFQISDKRRLVQPQIMRSYMRLEIPKGESLFFAAFDKIFENSNKNFGKEWRLDNITFLDNDLRELSHIEFKE